MLVNSSDKVIFRPGQYSKNSSAVISYGISKGKYINEKKIDKNKKSNNIKQIIALSTCSSAHDRERVVLLAYMIPIK